MAGSGFGAVVVFGLPIALTGLAEYEVMVNGALIVLIVAFAPAGLAQIGRAAGWAREC